MAENSPGTLRKIPSVTFLLTLPPFEAYLIRYPRTLILQVLRGLLDGKREELLAGRPTDITPEGIWQETGQRLKSKTAYHLRRVVNGTGVVIHTNLGRSLLASQAVSQMEAVARYYSNLEYDLDRGERGSRYSHVEGLLLELTGAEAALVVNNNAAAVLLALDSLARGREVVVSRGQLIEIGGSFRIPEVMSSSGAILREEGTTNKTHMRDYENALSDRTALLLKVHTSNFRLLGFTAEVSLERLVGLGRTHRIPVMEDLGSGSLLDLSPFGLEKEPTVQEAVRSGADLVSFSGDKLLGGPQAGIIVGREAMIQLLRQNPLNRALRIDKLTLAALEATLHLYRRPDQALREIPTLRLLSLALPEIHRRARRWLRLLRQAIGSEIRIELTLTQSQVGGGALPLSTPDSYALVLTSQTGTTTGLEKHLRSREIPIIGRIEKERLLLDLRTLQEDDRPVLLRGLKEWISRP
ncbi:MAG: L-seryl-tRNA(Sec) selenium transferase [Desulfobacteraceae bacterium]|nr:MAG: L-seryl-tRNA(Sec) selenium transferase [Desulfobacteraceae bacterium]